MTDNPYLTTSEAAAQIGVTWNAVNKLITRGKLPAVKVGGNWLILPADLEPFRQRVPGGAGRPRKNSSETG